MKTIRIFISSPGDVEEEREKARQVVERLAGRYTDMAYLKPILWENLPLQADLSFRRGIEKKIDPAAVKSDLDVLASVENGVDIAVFILWARLGSPTGLQVTKADGSEYRSGTEREFDLMLQARERSQTAGGVPRPAILAYTRSDDDSFFENLKSKDEARRNDDINQRSMAVKFIREEFHDAEGRNLRAYHTYKRPPEFCGRLRAHLIELLDEILGVEDPAERWEGSPYVGLGAFDFEQEKIFRGREREVCELGERLRARAEAGCASVVILGASGSGKSSLVRAGLLPSLCLHEVDDDVMQWRRAILRPGVGGEDLMQILVSALIGPDALPELLDGRVEGYAGLAADFTRDAELTLRHVFFPTMAAVDKQVGGAVRLVLLVDQLEEVFNPSIDEETRESFLQAVEMLARSGHVWVVATARSDFYAQIQSSPTMLRLKAGNGQYDLLPVTEDALRRIIIVPARMAGLRFETGGGSAPNLDERIFSEALHHPEALPHLQYLLQQLYERRSHGVLTLAAYHELGGVSGVLARRAESVIDGLNEEAQASFDEVMRGLVSVQVGGPLRAVRRIAALEALRGSDGQTVPHGQAVLVDTLISARFLATGRNHEGKATVLIAHEALLRSWPKLVNWIDRNRELLKTNAQIEVDAAVWIENRKDCDYLYAGSPLEKAVQAAKAGYLGKSEQEFVEASLNEVARQELAACILSGRNALETANRIEATQPLVYRDVINDSLRSSNFVVRRSVAILIGQSKGQSYAGELVRLLIDDSEESVRRAASLALIEIDDTTCYDRLLILLDQDGECRSTREALAMLLVSANNQTQKSRFVDWFAQRPFPLRVRTKMYSWALRLRRSAPVLLTLGLPAIILATLAAAIAKSSVGFLNYASVQSLPSVGMGLFHGATAGIILGGSIAIGLTLYRVVLGKEYEVSSLFRPFGALVAGALAGGLGGLLCVSQIAGVYSPQALKMMGWMARDKKPEGFLYYLLFENRCGLVFTITSAGLGLGMALMTNRMRSSKHWESFVREQKPLTGLKQSLKIVGQLVRVALPFSWPIPAVLIVAGAMALGAVVSADRAHRTQEPAPTDLFFGGMGLEVRNAARNGESQQEQDERIKQEIEASDEAITRWKLSVPGRALGIFGDGVGQAIGGFFAVIGMGFGIVIVRYGLHVEPRRSRG